jgi:CDP-diacylglycerol--serine O-phosphatidyltransferase
MYLANLALTIPVFSAIRLAIFNNDARQSIDFIGLPTPANALFFMSLPLVLKYDKLALATYIQNPIFLSIAIVVSCTLMVSEIRLFSLKIKNFSLNKHIYHIILIIVANILFLTISYTAIPIIVILYIILSVIKNFLQPKYHP